MNVLDCGSAMLKTASIEGNVVLMGDFERPLFADNIIKALSDILESAAIIKNDSLAQHIDIAWVEEGPACSVTIQTMDEIDG